MELELHDLLTAEFEEDGNGPTAFNCWNLCREVYRRAGKALPEYSQYIKDIVKRDKLIDSIRNNEYEFIKLNRPEFLAIVTLRLYRANPKAITHIGVMISKRRFIHITKKGVFVERCDMGRCTRKIEGFYRYAGTD